MNSVVIKYWDISYLHLYVTYAFMIALLSKQSVYKHLILLVKYFTRGNLNEYFPISRNW